MKNHIGKKIQDTLSEVQKNSNFQNKNISKTPDSKITEGIAQSVCLFENWKSHTTLL